MFDANRDMIEVPATATRPGMVGPGGMVVLTVEREGDDRTRITFEGMSASIRDDAPGLLFPARPIRPENAGDPTVAWLPADRDDFYREVSASRHGW